MHTLVRFWVVVLSLLTGVASLGYLSLSFLFPEAPVFAVDSATRLFVVLLAATAIGVVVWGTLSEEKIVLDQSRNQP